MLLYLAEIPFKREFCIHFYLKNIENIINFYLIQKGNSNNWYNDNIFVWVIKL